MEAAYEYKNKKKSKTLEVKQTWQKQQDNVFMFSPLID